MINTPLHFVYIAQNGVFTTVVSIRKIVALLIKFSFRCEKWCLCADHEH